MISSPFLTYTGFSKPFILDTDAIGDSIGAVLSQMQNGRDNVIAYVSRKLTKSERKYSVTKRESLAAVSFTQHFRHYLYGRRLHFMTDHLMI